MFNVVRSMFSVPAAAVSLDGELLELVLGDHLESNVNPRSLPPLTKSYRQNYYIFRDQSAA